MALTDDLVSYWKLDEASGDAIDAHSTNDLTDTNTVGAATGKINNGRDFEQGSQEHFSRADNADLSLGADTDFTFAGWMNIEDKTFNSTLVSKGEPTTTATLEYWLRYNSGNDRFSFSTGNSSADAIVSANNLGSPSTATWYFVVCWHDSGANKIFIQINNGTADEAAWSGGTWNGSGVFNLGGQVGSGVKCDGIIDEVGFWKRVLTSDERTSLYNGGAGLSYDNFTPAGGGIIGASLIGGRIHRSLLAGAA